MKRIQVILLVLLFVLLFHGNPVYGDSGISVGAGIETNIITLEEKSMALGGIISIENRFGPTFAAGVNIGAAYGWNNLAGIENRLFARWYFARALPVEFFFQGDAGLLITLRSSEPADSRGSPSAGLTLGMRIALPGRWYLEPYARGGYPYLGGAGIIAGYSPVPKSRLAGMSGGGLKKGEEVVVIRELGSVPEIAALAIEPYIYFSANIAGFTGLDLQTIENNYRLLREIAEFLRANGEYNLVIEGHANPVTDSASEEKMSLNPLSIARAETIAGTLINYGIDRKRLTIAGSGGTKTLVDKNDKENWQLNRRVEFMLIRSGTTGGKK